MNKKLTLIAMILAAIIGPVTTHYLNSLLKEKEVEKVGKDSCVNVTKNTNTTISDSEISVFINCNAVTNANQITMNQK